MAFNHAQQQALLQPWSHLRHSLFNLGERIPVTLRMAMDYDITAIAVATDTLGKLAELSGPSFAGELLRRSWHPVLFFPST